MFGRIPAIAALVLATSIVSLVSVAAPARHPAPQAPAASMGSTKTQAAKLSQDWKRVRTANFEAAGDAPAESIQRILVQLEVYRATLITRVLGLRAATTLPTLVIVFKDDDGFDRFKPRDGKGHKMGGVRAFFGEQPDTYLVVMSEFRGSDETLRTAYHEYFHFVVGQNMPDTPTARSNACRHSTRDPAGTATGRTTRSNWGISPPPPGTHGRSWTSPTEMWSRCPTWRLSAPSACGG